MDKTVQTNSISKACCGWVICGPIGALIMGINGGVSEKQYWVCGGCGNKFTSTKGMASDLRRSQAEASDYEEQQKRVEAERKKLEEINSRNIPYKYSLDLGEAVNEYEEQLLNHIDNLRGDIEYQYQERVIMGENSQAYRKTNGMMYKVAGITASLKPNENIIYCLAYDENFNSGIVMTNLVLYLSDERVALSNVMFVTEYGVYTNTGYTDFEQALDHDLVKLMRYVCCADRLLKDEDNGAVLKLETSKISTGVDRKVTQEGYYIKDYTLVCGDETVNLGIDSDNLVSHKGFIYYKKPLKSAITGAFKPKDLLDGMSQVTSAIKQKTGLGIDYQIMQVKGSTTESFGINITCVKDFQIWGDRVIIRKSSKDFTRNNLVMTDLNNPYELDVLVPSIVTAYIVTEKGLFYCTKIGKGLSKYALYHTTVLGGAADMYCELEYPISNLKWDGEYFYTEVKGYLYRFNKHSGMEQIITQVVNYDVTEEVVYFSTENGVFSIKEGERPVFLYPLRGIDDLYVYNNNLYMYNQGELTVQRTDGRYEVYEML
ncbi:hypothetical protein [Acetobacterium sp.]|uniref:hypothetical protein n=1 Tax=Acetobacterium sp. TaxID=1872094 RepID=UPI002725552A|nr:hypothetical protein [Acetobacterium sp.]MDO9493421.1 hypothetical protein [Acetobacterium sp.]